MQRAEKEKLITCFPKAWLETRTCTFLYDSQCEVISADVQVWCRLHICHLPDVTNCLLSGAVVHKILQPKQRRRLMKNFERNAKGPNISMCAQWPLCHNSLRFFTLSNDEASFSIRADM